MSNTKQNTLKASPFGAYDVSVVADGTRTLVEISALDEFGDLYLVGRGIARRRKGEKRDEALGQLIAFRRAFADALKNIDARLATMGKKGWANEPKTVDVDALLKKAKALANKGTS